MNPAEFIKLFQELSPDILQYPADLWWLIQRLNVLRPTIILEIGVHKGGTFRFWHDLLPQPMEENGLLIGIDIINIPWNVVSAKKVIFIRGDSQKENTVKILEKQLKGRLIDFLFIDGDHSYEGVKKDFHNYLPFVRENGIIAFHDVTAISDGPKEVFWEIETGRREVIMTQLRRGIGIWYRTSHDFIYWDLVEECYKNPQGDFKDCSICDVICTEQHKQYREAKKKKGEET